MVAEQEHNSDNIGGQGAYGTYSNAWYMHIFRYYKGVSVTRIVTIVLTHIDYGSLILYVLDLVHLLIQCRGRFRGERGGTLDALHPPPQKPQHKNGNYSECAHGKPIGDLEFMRIKFAIITLWV